MQVTIEMAVEAGRALGAFEADLARFEMEHCKPHPEAGNSYLCEQTAARRASARKLLAAFPGMLIPRPVYRQDYEGRTSASDACNARNAERLTGEML